MLKPEWTIRSFYIGKKKSLQDISFPTGYEFGSEEEAESYGSALNSIRVDRWPGHEFEFRVVPIETVADTTGE